jgi:hypothetical protein
VRDDRLAPVLGELVPTLRRFGELDVSEEVAVAQRGMSAATIDRRLAADRAKLEVRGHSGFVPPEVLGTHRAREVLNEFINFLT